MKKNTLTVERVQTELLPLYTEARADGTCVTDEESFAVDIVADVLIWAVLKGGEELDVILTSARDHAQYEIDHNPEQE